MLSADERARLAHIRAGLAVVERNPGLPWSDVWAFYGRHWPADLAWLVGVVERISHDSGTPQPPERPRD